MIGVEAADAVGMTASLKVGKVVTLDNVGLFADGAAVKTIGTETFRVCSRLVDEIVIPTRFATPSNSATTMHELCVYVCVCVLSADESIVVTLVHDDDDDVEFLLLLFGWLFAGRRVVSGVGWCIGDCRYQVSENIITGQTMVNIIRYHQVPTWTLIGCCSRWSGLMSRSRPCR